MMIKKFDEFVVLEEGVITKMKDYFSKNKDIKSGYQPGDEPAPESNNLGRRMGPRKAPKEEITFPCVYSFLTKELIDRKKAKGQKHIGIRPDGYAFFCETPEELDNYKYVYRIGEKYRGETIINFNIGPEQN